MYEGNYDKKLYLSRSDPHSGNTWPRSSEGELDFYTYLLLKGLMPTKPGPRPRELVKHLRYHGP